jgi:hypothetical protein
MTPSNRWRLGILLVLAYVALSWAARFDMRLGDASLVYPLDTFSMYAGAPADTIGHLLIRDADGELHRVRDFSAYHYDDLIRYIDGQRGLGTIPVDLIFRTWRLHQSEPPSVDADCVIAHCTVSR